MAVTPDATQPVRIREFVFSLGVDLALPLPDNDVHLWRGQLGCEREVVDPLRELLSPDELERASRFHFPTSRDEFIVSRGSLRSLLGLYLKQPASQLRFSYSQFGRPELVFNDEAEKVEFNVSHSGTMLLLAFTQRRRIGVDVERVRKDFSTTEIAERFFSLVEREALRELSIQERHEAFFRCWTRKEAFIKALGEGLSHPLDQFDVSLAPGVPATLLATRPDSADAKRWSLWDIAVSDGYAGALAVEALQEKQ